MIKNATRTAAPASMYPSTWSVVVFEYSRTVAVQVVDNVSFPVSAIRILMFSFSGGGRGAAMAKALRERRVEIRNVNIVAMR